MVEIISGADFLSSVKSSFFVCAPSGKKIPFCRPQDLVFICPKKSNNFEKEGSIEDFEIKIENENKTQLRGCRDRSR